MKKVYPFLIGIFVTITFFYACDVSKQLSDVQKVGYQCNNYLTKSPNTMNRGQVLEMVRNYYNNQYQALHDPLSPSKLRGLDPSSPVDSRAVFFSLDTLKRLLYYIEYASKNFTAAEKQNIGVNIYFASYPESMHKMHNGLNYTNRHTLVFIPSLFNPTSNKAEDIDLSENIFGKKDFPIPLNNLFFSLSNLNKSMVALGSSTSSSGMNSQNDGTAIPPPPPPTGNTLLDLTDPY